MAPRDSLIVVLLVMFHRTALPHYCKQRASIPIRVGSCPQRRQQPEKPFEINHHRKFAEKP
jgi:hypothetical protein